MLWGLGLLIGSIHPVGLVLTLLVFACWTVFAAVWGLVAAIKASEAPRDANGNQSLLAMFFHASAALPYVMPSGLNSVLWGSCSPLLVLWLTQFSYRDLRNLFFYAVFPHLDWIGIQTGEGAFQVGLLCLLGSSCHCRDW